MKGIVFRELFWPQGKTSDYFLGTDNNLEPQGRFLFHKENLGAQGRTFEIKFNAHRRLRKLITSVNFFRSLISYRKTFNPRKLVVAIEKTKGISSIETLWNSRDDFWSTRKSLWNYRDDYWSTRKSLNATLCRFLSKPFKHQEHFWKFSTTWALWKITVGWYCKKDYA